MRRKFEHFKELYQQDLNAAADDLDAAVSGISFTTDLALSVKDADLTIEAITENLVIKKDFYTNLDSLAPPKTIFCTNSSAFLPSQFAAETHRPKQFPALHFPTNLLQNNLAEIMGYPDTEHDF
jgi:3-hydroxybutyryl-CoA dehydrogenase